MVGDELLAGQAAAGLGAGVVCREPLLDAPAVWWVEASRGEERRQKWGLAFSGGFSEE